MKYVLLTGATGLVGRYLLRDLLDRGLQVAVIVRSSRAATAGARIESVMAYWESLAGRSLRRPVVLGGDLREPNLGLSAADRGWIAEHCDRVVHSGASMTFREDKQGEPFRTNVDGMRNLLALCRELNIGAFHHVSTAYVCGLRSGRILETEVDLGQQNGNVYEVSKLAAEKMLRAADFLKSTTIYRPASVVGDSRTGFTTSSHGFYLPLQLAYLIADKVPSQLMGERFLKLLGLAGDEGKNLVPVDWLSAAIAHLVAHPEHHGRTYHLTNPQPVAVRLIQQVVREAIECHCPNRFTGQPTEEELTAYEAQFKDYMEIYRSHWRDDPVFDRTHTELALPHLPCPAMDHDRMFRVASYPIERKFVLHRNDAPFAAGKAGCSIEQRLLELLPAAESRPAAGASANDRPAPLDPAPGDVARVGLEITGVGGGQWSLVLRRNEFVGLERGLHAADFLRYYLTGRTYTALVSGRASVESSLAAGRVAVERRAGAGQLDERDVFRRLVSPPQPDAAAKAASALA